MYIYYICYMDIYYMDICIYVYDIMVLTCTYTTYTET